MTLSKMEDLLLVLPSLNLSILDAGILIMVQPRSKIDDVLIDMVAYPMSFLSMSVAF